MSTKEHTMALETKKPTTLADVLEALTVGAPEDTIRHRARVSALRRIAELLHRPPSDLPADIKLLRRQLLGLHPAQCGVTAKTLSNIKSNLADALKATGAMVDDPRHLARTPAWEAFLSRAPSDHQRWGLSRFVDYCCANRIEPADVDLGVFDAFHEHLDNPMTADGLSRELPKVTERHLGVALRPHAFRHVAATSVAETAPEHVNIIKDLLGHATLDMAQKHYNRATGISSCNALQSIMEDIRDDVPKMGRAKRQRRAINGRPGD